MITLVAALVKSRHGEHILAGVRIGSERAAAGAGRRICYRGVRTRGASVCARARPPHRFSPYGSQRWPELTLAVVRVRLGLELCDLLLVVVGGSVGGAGGVRGIAWKCCGGLYRAPVQLPPRRRQIAL